jgi:hypothetical protein
MGERYCAEQERSGCDDSEAETTHYIPQGFCLAFTLLCRSHHCSVRIGNAGCDFTQSLVSFPRHYEDVFRAGFVHPS